MISICILNWNCCETLVETLKVLNEIKNLDFEIIIFDQGSTDSSIDFLTNAQSNNLRVIFSDKNVGNSISRNSMINLAKHKYVMLLDADIVPIKKSVENMVKFMEENDFAYIGYDFMSYSDNWDKVTKEETEIDNKDVIIHSYKIALTQYGVFRKSCLLQCPFPEFYPFDQPGWGCEDDIVGLAIFENKLGDFGFIKKRTYFHNKGSSHKQLKDDFDKMYARRYIYYKYFKDFLSPKNKIESLIKKKILSTNLKCNKYHWSIEDNLGDVATDIILKDCFPFFDFNENEKTNLLIFGGTLLNHIDNANKLYNADFRNILYYGVGVSNQYEVSDALRIIEKNKISFKIIPRGPKTKEVLNRNSISCEDPCGDVLQLFSLWPIIKSESEQPLHVVDVYRPDLFETPNNSIKIKVANNKNSFPNVVFNNLTSFFENLKKYGKVYSSQIHPFLISAMVGKPCYLHPKDWRARDFSYFSNFKLDMTSEDSINLRKESQKNIRNFIDSFFINMKKFIYE